MILQTLSNHFYENLVRIFSIKKECITLEDIKYSFYIRKLHLDKEGKKEKAISFKLIVINTDNRVKK